MSFDQLSSLEAGQRRGNVNYTDDPEFQRLSQQLNSKLFKLQSNISNLSRDIGHLGTRQDTARVRERVQDLLEESREVYKELGEGVKKIQGWENVTVCLPKVPILPTRSTNLRRQPTQRYTQQKLSREFQASLSEFQSLQQRALEKQKASVSAARAVQDEGSDAVAGAASGGQQPEQQQQQELVRLAAQDEVDFQEAIIIEREDMIRDIEQGVGDLNVLFTQVASMVHEQGQQLDTINDNVENVRVDTRGADIELRSAARYQKNARSKACCLMMILLIILTIVLLAIFVG